MRKPLFHWTTEKLEQVAKVFGGLTTVNASAASPPNEDQTRETDTSNKNGPAQTCEISRDSVLVTLSKAIAGKPVIIDSQSYIYGGTCNIKGHVFHLLWETKDFPENGAFRYQPLADLVSAEQKNAGYFGSSLMRHVWLLGHIREPTDASGGFFDPKTGISVPIIPTQEMVTGKRPYKSTCVVETPLYRFDGIDGVYFSCTEKHALESFIYLAEISSGCFSVKTTDKSSGEVGKVRLCHLVFDPDLSQKMESTRKQHHVEIAQLAKEAAAKKDVPALKTPTKKATDRIKISSNTFGPVDEDDLLFSLGARVSLQIGSKTQEYAYGAAFLYNGKIIDVLWSLKDSCPLSPQAAQRSLQKALSSSDSTALSLNTSMLSIKRALGLRFGGSLPPIELLSGKNRRNKVVFSYPLSKIKGKGALNGTFLDDCFLSGTLDSSWSRIWAASGEKNTTAPVTSEETVSVRTCRLLLREDAKNMLKEVKKDVCAPSHRDPPQETPSTRPKKQKLFFRYAAPGGGKK